MRTITGVLLLAAAAFAGDLEWRSDIEAARTEARLRRRPLLAYVFDKI